MPGKTKQNKMKRTIAIIIMLISTFPVAIAQQYGWKDISENIPLEAELTDVFFVSEDEGWITTAFADSAILHTTDGAASFEIQKVPLSPDIYAIHMLDSLNGYCGGPSGWIYKTSNGGQNWNILASMGSLTDISFPPGANPENHVGYSCGDFGNIWEIKDGLTNLNTGLSGTFRGISTSSENNLWSCGENHIYYYDGNYFYDQSTPSGTFNDIHFINDNEGWVVGNSSIVAKTDNGGDTWNSLTNPDPQERSLFGLFFIDSNRGWAVGNDGLILRTEDGGLVWMIEADGITNENLSAVHFTSHTNGYVVGNNNTLLKYTEVSEIDENSHSFKFDLFPNPANGNVRIKCSEFKTEAGTIEILSTEGKTLQKKTVGIGNTDIEIDLKDLSAGMYMCRITIGNNSSTRKLIIE
jgi:photosystem II stability/assembly factor-like uncharacterized protein